MEREIVLDSFDKAADLLGEKFKIFWPSNENTPPTESNITTACVQAFSPSEFYVFTEVPFKKHGKQGRIDFLAIHKQRNFMVVGEMKSHKKGYDKEITDDFKRMLDFDLETTTGYNSKYPLTVFPKTTYIFAAFWIEYSKEIERLKGLFDQKNHSDTSHFTKLVLECEDKRYYPLTSQEGGLHLFLLLKEKGSRP